MKHAKLAVSQNLKFCETVCLVLNRVSRNEKAKRVSLETLYTGIHVKHPDFSIKIVLLFTDLLIFQSSFQGASIILASSNKSLVQSNFFFHQPLNFLVDLAENRLSGVGNTAI
jgi:sugar diacid utilization regulator